MPLLQESQPGRELVSSSRGNKMKCEDSDQLSLSTSNPTVPFPSLHHLTPAQLLASQTAALMAAGLPVSLHATLSSSPALFHHSLLQAAATAWNAGAATTPALSPTLKARKHNNNNNNVVSSSSGDTAIKSLAKRAKQTRITNKQTNDDNKQQRTSPSPGDNKETTWFSPPASASSPAIGEKEKQTAWLSPSSTDSKMITERSWFSSPPSGSSPPSSTENKETTASRSWFSSGSSPPSVDSNVTKEPTGRDKQFTCGVCNRSFGYKHVLQNHERTHTGEKPFECPQCRKRFTRDHHLKTHMRLHTGERPYHCDHCDRQFVQVANLRRHLRVHTGERPYSCEQCGSRFSDSNQLKAHVLIHKGEKPYVCEKCNGRFRRRHHLMHHKCIASSIPMIQASPPPACMTIKDEELEEDVGTKIHERKSKDVRRVIRMPSVAPIITLPLRVALPEQTEPEDLSMSTGHHNVHSHSHSSGDSPLSRSPSSDNRDEDEEDLDEAATLFLKHEVRRLPSLS